MTLRLIVDTDIGTDVDDCLALAFLLGSPEVRLEGITTVYGDVALRARMVEHLLRLRGVEGVPIRLGVRPPLLGLRPVYWEGHEGQGLLDETDAAGEFPSEHAVDFIVRTVLDNPGEIDLLAIGPLANVAAAFLREPTLAQKLRRLTIMGGSFRAGDRFDLPVGEHNVVCDPEAAHIVFSAGAPMTVVPLDVTTRCRIDTEDVARLEALADPFHGAVADQVRRYPRFARQGHTALHDPLAAAVLLEPDLVETEDLNVAVETTGRLTTGATIGWAPSERYPATAAVALRVDRARAEAFILERLLR